MNSLSSSLGISALLGATAFISQTHAANVIVNSDFDNDSGTPITSDGSANIRAISGWGSMHLYRHAYAGTLGPKLSEVGDRNYGVNDDIVLGDSSTSDTYKGLSFTDARPNPSQTVNLTSALDAGTLAAVVSGTAQFSFSAWMAGFGTDIVATQLQFFASTDGSGTALSTLTLDRGVITNQQTTADILVNPGGPNNATSMTSSRYWGLYEIQGLVPTTAQSLTVRFVAGTGNATGGQNDWYVDQVIVDIVPEPGVASLTGLAALGLLRRRRRA